MDNLQRLQNYSTKIEDGILQTKEEFKKEVIDVLGSERTIELFCELYLIIHYDKLKQGLPIDSDSKLKSIIEEIIKWVKDCEFVENQNYIDFDYSLTKKYFYKMLQVEQTNSVFKSTHTGLFKVFYHSDKQLEFKYATNEIDNLEAVNHILITDYLEYPKSKVNRYLEENGRSLESRLNSMELIFELPDDYQFLE